MSSVGVDLEQFVRDPYATGIQRVLQQLAVHWPEGIDSDWVVPNDDGTYFLATSAQAAELLTLAFTSSDGDDLRHQVNSYVLGLRDDRNTPRVRLGQLVSLFDSWLLPEVSYLPSVLERLDIFARSMPVTMIGYDALPMSDPGNYRFVPGQGANASEYFRRLSLVDAVVCISEFTRAQVLDLLRRDRSMTTLVAHPGGDHLPVQARHRSQVSETPTFIRLGTMESRKRPIEILRGFLSAIRGGAQAELVFVGNPNASSETVNAEIEQAIANGYPVTWIRGASDAQVHGLVSKADAFLSFGVEGFGIPVLEAIRLGTPVIFDGIQPAAEVMEGRGAVRVAAGDEEQIAAMFHAWSSPQALAGARSALDANGVPTWADFARAVAGAASRD